MKNPPNFGKHSFQVLLQVYNESSRIYRVLSYFIVKCPNILVVDNFSTDDTLLIIQKHFPTVQIVQISNNGTTEIPGWWRQCSEYFTYPYIYIASCSEQPTYDLLDYCSIFAHSAVGDLLEVPRVSVTAGKSTNHLFCLPSSVFYKSIMPSTVIRFVR